nr:CDP-glucose 4,6-dehydratase [Enterovirga sp. DB1703]
MAPHGHAAGQALPRGRVGLGPGEVEDVVISSDFWLGRRVFLTGHTGFKGAWLALMLDRLNAAVTGYALDPPTTPSAFDLLGVRDALSDGRGDICDLAALDAALGAAEPEIVFHLAAQSLVRRGYADPPDTFRTNVLGTANLLDCVRRVQSVRLVVVVTTDKCYENREAETGYAEGDRLGGADPYSASKACAELVSASFRESFLAEAGTRVVTVRAGNVIGGGDFAVDRIIPDAFRAFASGDVLGVRNPDAVRPWQHVLEPLRGYLLLAERALSGAPVSDAYNFGPGPEGEHDVAALLGHLAAGWGGKAAWRHDRSPQPKETRLLRLDTTRAREELGWHPLLPFGEAVLWTAEWYRAFAERRDMAAFTREQADRYLGQCVRLVPPFREARPATMRAGGRRAARS